MKNSFEQKAISGIKSYANYLRNTQVKRMREQLTLRQSARRSKNTFMERNMQYHGSRKGFRQTVGFVDKLGKAGRDDGVYWYELLSDGGARRPSKSSYIWVPIRANLQLGKEQRIPPGLRPNRLIKRKTVEVKTLGRKKYLVKYIKAKSKGEQTMFPLYVLKRQTHYDKKFYSFNDVTNTFVKKNDLTDFMWDKIKTMPGNLN